MRWGRTKEQVQCIDIHCLLCPQVNEFLGGDAETTSILVPEENNKHMLELVGLTLVAIGCELEPRPPFLVVRKRFCDKDALEAFYARQEAFKQDLLTETEWLGPVLQAEGTSFDQLIARLSCTDPIATNAPDRMEEPVQAGGRPALHSRTHPIGSPGGVPGPGGPGHGRGPGGSSTSIDASFIFHRRCRIQHPFHSPIMASFLCSLCSTPLRHYPLQSFRVQLLYRHIAHRFTITAPLNRAPFLRNETLILCSKTRILRNRTATPRNRTPSPRNKTHTRVTLGCKTPRELLHLWTQGQSRSLMGYPHAP